VKYIFKSDVSRSASISCWPTFQVAGKGIEEKGSATVPQSVLEAIQLGIWDYEPDESESAAYEATDALPGSDEKLEVMARRIREGLPLWHPEDRRTYDGLGWDDV